MSKQPADPTAPPVPGRRKPRSGWVTIVYRRLTVKGVGAVDLLDRMTAEQYAAWFRALADPTRVQLVALLAGEREPMSVGQIAAEMRLAQSTVSQHLKILAGVRFVLVDPVGNARYYRINDACVQCFPNAADLVMGKPAPDTPGGR
jgi:DNA-binding transcriptional ArsR family regulator